MKIGIWSALGRLGSYSTGVGKHVTNMACGLAGKLDWDVRLLLSSDLCAEEISPVECTRMDGIPGIRLPLNRRTLELLWRTTRHPLLDRWLDGADWVYCPKELYVPVRRARYAVTVHDLYRVEPEFRHQSVRSTYRWGHLLERAMHEADVVLSVSEFTKHRLMELVGLKPERIRVVGNGVEDRFFAADLDDSTENTYRDGSPYILSVGGVTRKKGAENLLAAAAELARTDPQLTLVIVGPVEPEFAAQVSEASNIRIVRRGFPDSAMHRLVRNSAVLLVLSEYEGFGIPALEAMAAGVPVVAANRAALPEVVGRAGMLVEPKNSEEVAHSVQILLNDMDVRSDLITRGRARADTYRWSACVQRLRLALEEFSAQSKNVAIG